MQICNTHAFKGLVPQLPWTSSFGYCQHKCSGLCDVWVSVVINTQLVYVKLFKVNAKMKKKKVKIKLLSLFMYYSFSFEFLFLQKQLKKKERKLFLD